MHKHYYIIIRKALFVAFLCYTATVLKADTVYTIKVHFLYGSKPAKGYKKHESKYFGGIHGGHVSIQYGDSVYGFVPSGRFHVFAHRKKRHSAFVSEPAGNWAEDTASEKYASFIIPLDSQAYFRLINTQRSYLTQSPYDYAFIGMRCAAATYDLLSNAAGIFKQKTKTAMIAGYFYPKKLRKEIFRLGAQNGYVSYGHKGRSSRKWEND